MSEDEVLRHHYYWGSLTVDVGVGMRKLFDSCLNPSDVTSYGQR